MADQILNFCHGLQSTKGTRYSKRNFYSDNDNFQSIWLRGQMKISTYVQVLFE